MRTSLKTMACFLLVVGLASACTTSTYGNAPRPIAGTDNEYLLKVYIGGFAAGATADTKASRAIDAYMEEAGYESYEVLSRRHNLIPSYFEYHLRFKEPGQDK